MKQRNFVKLLLLIAVFATLAIPAFAFMPPAKISGHVYVVDGDSVNDIENGHELTAMRGSTNLGTVDIVGGHYLCEDIKSSDAIPGDIIKLYVDDVLAKTFELEGSETVNIYLNEDLEPPGCVEDWFCTAWSDWSVCTDGSQSKTRTCTDLNDCGTTDDKPSTTSMQSCGTDADDDSPGGRGPGGGGGGDDDKDDVAPTPDKDTDEDEPKDDDIIVDKDSGNGQAITGGFINTLTKPSVIVTALVTVVVVLGLMFHFKKK